MQWLFSLPAEGHPALNGDCTQGQYDRVFFLAPSLTGQTDERYCTIPANKPIFFGLAAAFSTGPIGGRTLLDLRRGAAQFVDAVTEVSCELDGVSCASSYDRFRVTSPAFSVAAPPDGLTTPDVITVPNKGGTVVSDGYFILLRPLSPGSHTLHITTTGAPANEQDVTWHITVE